MLCSIGSVLKKSSLFLGLVLKGGTEIFNSTRTGRWNYTVAVLPFFHVPRRDDNSISMKEENYHVIPCHVTPRDRNCSGLDGCFRGPVARLVPDVYDLYSYGQPNPRIAACFRVQQLRRIAAECSVAGVRPAGWQEHHLDGQPDKPESLGAPGYLHAGNEQTRVRQHQYRAIACQSGPCEARHCEPDAVAVSRGAQWRCDFDHRGNLQYGRRAGSTPGRHGLGEDCQRHGSQTWVGRQCFEDGQGGQQERFHRCFRQIGFKQRLGTWEIGSVQRERQQRRAGERRR